MKAREASRRLAQIEKRAAGKKPILVLWQDFDDESCYHSNGRTEQGAADDRLYSESDLSALADRHTLIVVTYKQAPIMNPAALRGASAE